MLDAGWQRSSETNTLETETSNLHVLNYRDQKGLLLAH